MRIKTKPASPITRWILTWLALACFAMATPGSELMRLEAQLLWGTNDAKSPDPKHKPVDAEIQSKLKGLPLKWSHYFEVNRQDFKVPAQGTNTVALSEKCKLQVKNHGNGTVEVSLIGKGEHVAKRTQALPKGEVLVLGGNAPNSTAWLVVVKRLE
jgi:hypothetical protein